MKRLLPILLILPALLIPAAPSQAAAQQIMSCGQSNTGWELWRGAGASRPNTRCSFVRATFRRVMYKRDHGTGLRHRFGIRVRGRKMLCRVQNRTYWRIFCQGRKRYVELTDEL